ncbi:hypothetical protein [Eubacterium callanderi]|uniref:hypothetical protein n=1 Tax=Eubacterium callanderi TaxID=53442 RepID=UPI0026742070|nr:hypothetical protein [Eubacterium callanderi]
MNGNKSLKQGAEYAEKIKGYFSNYNIPIVVESARIGEFEALLISIIPQFRPMKRFRSIVPTKREYWDIALNNFVRKVNHIYGEKIIPECGHESDVIIGFKQYAEEIFEKNNKPLGIDISINEISDNTIIVIASRKNDSNVQGFILKIPEIENWYFSIDEVNQKIKEAYEVAL